MADVSVTRQLYSRLADGQDVESFTLDSGDGLSVQVMTYGATLQRVSVPDREGRIGNVVTTCSDWAGWQACGSFFGSTVGRFANRIAKGQFELAGQKYQLAKNNGPNHLHGGPQGFDKQHWEAEVQVTKDLAEVKFTYVSRDGEEGYPGNLKVTATYSVTRGQQLRTSYQAETDQPTVVNLTNHAYWNLSGCGEQGPADNSILEHQLQIFAQQSLEVDDGLIPTGRLLDVAETALDFRSPRPIGQQIAAVENSAANGYDHCFAVDGLVGHRRPCASVYDPKSGRTLDIETTQPGVQLYTANHFDGGPNCGGYTRFSAFCLETQGFPDAPNQPDFPSAVLEPGQKYDQETLWRFGVRG